MTRKIAIANEKGGVGKTATSTNVSAAIAKMGLKVLMIDIDSQCNATMSVGVDPRETEISTYELIRNYKDIDPNKAVISTKWDNFYLIPAHPDLISLELELVSQVGRENRLKRCLSSLDSSYDFIIIDTPPSLSLLTINVFAYITDIIIPCQTHPYAFKAIKNLYETLDTIKDEINPALNVLGILPTFYNERTKIGRDIIGQLLTSSEYKQILFKTQIRNNITIAESNKYGIPIIYYREDSIGAQDYTKLATEIINMG